MRSPKLKITRDGALLGTGILLTVNEAVFRSASQERPYLYVLFGGMMGLPVFLRQDEKRPSPPETPVSPPPTSEHGRP